MTPETSELETLCRFSRSLTLMIEANVSIVRSLLALELAAGREAWKEAIHEVRTDIETGAALSEALDAHPEQFPEMLVVTARRGETGGDLRTAMRAYADYLERERSLTSGGQTAAVGGAREMSLWLRRAATLLTVGAPITEALRVSVSYPVSEELREAALLTAEAVSEGASLSQKLAEHPSVIPAMVPALVASGEGAGALDRIFFCLADYFEMPESGESQPGESQPGESQPGESQPSESQPGESQPGESQPGESQPGEGGVQSAPRTDRIPGGMTPRNLSAVPEPDGASRSDIEEMIERLIYQPADAGATDLHLQPTPEGMRVRRRVDGVLSTIQDLDRSQRDAIVARVKMMADLNLADRSTPQEGRILIRVGEKGIPIRVNTFPYADGEAIHLAMTERQAAPDGLRNLGMTDGQQAVCFQLLTRPHGLLGIACEDVSETNRVLYGMLRELDDRGILRESSAATIEDPVEAELPGIMQVQVNRSRGLSTAAALQNIGRQDIDVIVVGRLSDADAAAEAVVAAASGRMVLAGLDARDTRAALEFLLQLDPGVAAEEILGVVAQRNLRTLCKECRGAGCAGCGGSVYRGSVPLFEVLALDSPQMRRLLYSGADPAALYQAAVDAGMTTFEQSAESLAAAGVTDAAEVERALR